jgi:hypothetical protein
LCRSGLAGTGFIDLPVTIVVFAVTSLCLRKDLAATGAPASSRTALCAFFAESFAYLRGVSGVAFFANDAIIDTTVAVVVFVVTDLLRWPFLTSARPPGSVGQTGLCSLFALAGANSTRLLCANFAGTTLVYFAIAIVVFAIAHLFGGLDLSKTGSPTIGCATILLPGSTDSLSDGGEISSIARALLACLAFFCWRRFVAFVFAGCRFFVTGVCSTAIPVNTAFSADPSNTEGSGGFAFGVFHTIQRNTTTLKPQQKAQYKKAGPQGPPMQTTHGIPTFKPGEDLSEVSETQEKSVN